jgi:integrase
MSRRKGDGEGTVELKTIAGRRVWFARWVEYSPDGTRRRPERILGAASEISGKKEAKEMLADLIRQRTGRITAKVEAASTFAGVWKRYVTLKTPSWSRANTKTLTSVFDRAVLPAIGDRDIASLSLEPLQAVLNHMAEMRIGKKGDQVGIRTGYGESAIKKARRYMTAMFEFAIGEDLVARNPAKKLEIPRCRKPSERFYSLDEVRRLLAGSQGREHLILHLMILCGLRPGEVFALRTQDIEPGRLLIDESVVDAEKGAKRMGETKTDDSHAYVALSADLENRLRAWAAVRPAGSLLFPTEVGTPWRIGNYLKRVLKPLAAELNPPIEDMTHQALRRTFATHFQRHGSVKDTQTQLRHSDPETTLRYYQKEIPDSVRAAVESFEIAIKGPIQ